MRVTIPDDLAEALTARLPPGALLDAEVTRLLEATKHTTPGVPMLVLNLAQLTTLAEALGRPTQLLSFTDILASLSRLAGLSFGHLRMDFSPGQLEELQRRADREQMPVAEYAVRVVRSITNGFFTTAPARGEWVQVQDARDAAPADDLISVE